MSTSCQTDSDCSGPYTCQNSVCTYPGLWPPSALDVITYLIIPWVVGVGNVGGLGGGVVKVPLIMLMLSYTSKEATFISYCILFGSCLSNSTLLIFKKHPTKRRPLIDFNIVMIINPMVLLGTNIGIFLNVLLPEIAAGLLFIVFLLSILPFLFKKGKSQLALRRKQQKQEQLNAKGNGNQEKLLGAADIAAAKEEEEEVVIAHGRTSSTNRDQFQRGQNSSESSLVSLDAEKNVIPEVKMNAEVEWLIEEDAKQRPWKKLSLLIVIFISVQMFVFLRGGKGLASFVGITTCSTEYWMMCAGILAVVIIASFVIRYFLIKWERRRNEIIDANNLRTHPDYADEIDFQNPKKYIHISFAGFGAGALAGTFGVGAGLALVPILLAAGVIPQVTAATSGFNYFFISLTTIIQVFTNHYLSISQIGWFAFLSFIGGFVCARLIYQLVEKHKAAHVVVFFVFGLAVLNIISFVVYLVRKDIDQGWDSLTSISPFCSQ